MKACKASQKSKSFPLQHYLLCPGWFCLRRIQESLWIILKLKKKKNTSASKIVLSVIHSAASNCFSTSCPTYSMWMENMPTWYTVVCHSSVQAIVLELMICEAIVFPVSHIDFYGTVNWVQNDLITRLNNLWIQRESQHFLQTVKLEWARNDLTVFVVNIYFINIPSLKNTRLYTQTFLQVSNRFGLFLPL